MNYHKIIMLILFAFLGLKANAQRVYGTVKGLANEKVIANIFIKNPIDNDLVIEFFQSKEDETFDFKLENYQSKILIEFKAMGYATHKDSILNLEIGKSYFFDVRLVPENFELEEVTIATNRTVVIKNDTTEYYPKAFLNGTERKVEDLIKRLPGMEVSESGRIKYLGKVVESVQLDGDDLFGSRYNLGTKNMAIDLVEKIQAIDNFTSNPLLKGLVNSESVSLNIVLKKTKTQLNSEANIGLGYGFKNSIKRDIGINVLALNNRIKSYGTISHNNVGINNVNSDFETFNPDEINTILRPKYADVILPDNAIYKPINSVNARINNELSGNYNFLIRISKKLLFKANTHYSLDNLNSIEANHIEFKNQNFTYSDQLVSSIKPENKEIITKLEYSINSKNLFTVESKFKQDFFNNQSEIVQNGVFNFSKKQVSKALYLTNIIEYTHKISDKSAWQYKSIYTNSKISQLLNFSIIQTNSIGDSQAVENNLSHFQNQFFLFHKLKNSKINLSVGNIYSVSYLNTNLLKNKEGVQGGDNNINLTSSNTFIDLKFIYEKFKWQLNSEINVSEFNNTVTYIREGHNLQKRLLVGMPKVILNFSPTSKHKAYISAEMNFMPITTKNAFSGFVLEDTRSVKLNDLSLNLEKSEQLNLGYRYHEAFSFFSTSINLYLKKNSNTFINKITYNDNFVVSTQFRSPKNVINNGVTIGLDKLVPLLKTSFRTSINLGILEYQNVISNSELRLNSSINKSFNLFVKTGFSLPFGVENGFTIFQNNFRTIQESAGNKLTGIENKFKLLYKPSKKIVLISTFNSFSPQLHLESNFHFLDFEVNYKPKNKSKIIEYRLLGSNLLNTRFFKIVENSDFEVTNYQSNLIGRYLMGMVVIRF